LTNLTNGETYSESYDKLVIRDRRRRFQTADPCDDATRVLSLRDLTDAGSIARLR